MISQQNQNRQDKLLLNNFENPDLSFPGIVIMNKSTVAGYFTS